MSDLPHAAESSDEPGQTRETPSLSLLEIPTATSVVFALVVVMSIGLLLPLDVSSNGRAEAGSLMLLSCNPLWLGLLSVFAIALRLQFTFPDRWVKKYHARRLAEMRPDLVNCVNDIGRRLNVDPLPTVLYTEEPGVFAQSFGTFRRRYIAFNKAELPEELAAVPSLVERQDSERPSAGSQAEHFEVIAAHELAHFKNGDHWKLRLAQYILATYCAGLIFLVAGGVIALGPKSFLLTAPAQAWMFVITVVETLVVPGAMLYVTWVLRDIREHYADAWAKKLYGQAAVMRAWAAEDRLVAESAASNTGLNRRAWPWEYGLGLAFARDQTANERMEALLSGPFTPRWLRQIVFAGGLAIGSMMFSWGETGAVLLVLGTVFGGVWVSLTYLLPHMAKPSQQRRDTVLQCLVVTVIFVAGILTSGAARNIMYFSVLLLTRTTYTINHDISTLLFFVVMVLIQGIALFVALLSLVPVIRWYHSAMQAGRLPMRWTPGLFLLLIVQGASTMAVVATIVRAVDFGLSQGDPLGLLVLLGPLVLVLPLYAGYLIIVRRIILPKSITQVVTLSGKAS
jgi:hypothetical protein